MKRRQRRSWKQRRLAPPIARRHQPKSQSTALYPSFLLLSYLLRPLDCLLFVSCTPDDLTRLFASESRFMMLLAREPPLARRPAPQKASDNESLPDAILPYWPARAFDEGRFRGLHDNFPEPKDSPRKYPRHAVQSHL